MTRLDKKMLPWLLLPVLAAGGYWGWAKSHHPDEQGAAAPQPAVRITADTLHFDPNAPQLTFLQIKAVAAYPEPLAEPLNAHVAYDDNRTARVFSPVAGRVLKIAAEAGRTIRAGEPLLVMDSPDFAMAAADAAKAQADLARKKDAYDRARQLLEVQGVARKDVEAAEDDWRQAEAEAQRARAHLRNLNGNALDAGGNFILRAPVGGVISERQVNVGSEVRPDAAGPLFVITDPKRLWVLVDLPERELDKIQVGQPVSIEVDAYPDEAFSGRVAVVGETLDPVTRRIQVRCDVDNSSGRLKPEMFARVIPLATSAAAMPRIPNTALVTQGLHSYLFVEQGPGVLQRRHVVLGLQGSEYSYVREGLHAGERVVTSGALLLNSELSESE